MNAKRERDRISENKESCQPCKAIWISLDC